MSKVLRSFLWGFLMFFVYWAGASEPARNYSDKTVAELLDLLENNDGTVRQCAAIFLGDRYRDHETAVVNGIMQLPNSPDPELPLPAAVIPKLSQHLKTDPDVLVRLCAVGALRDLKFRTNTTPILIVGLIDKDAMIRIRTCAVLIEISQKYSEPLQADVLPTLTECLAPDGEEGNIWYAAYIAGPLGSSGRPLVSALERLKMHESSKVRHYASEALLKIQQP
jgi:hypothetical protein